MTVNRLLLLILPAAIMVAAMILTSGMEHRLAALGTTVQAKLMLGRAGSPCPILLPPR
ncbi:conjugal transfer coupling protein TraG [Agrobacterium tumefaciens]|nr:conjugal transfer coupling protein TraG [Agrobacterium tumefaciens]